MALVAFALLLPALGHMIVRVDAHVAATLHAHVTPDATTGFRLVTHLGSSAVLVVVTALAAGYLARSGRRQAALLLVVTLIGAQALTWSLKATFRRERPSFDDPIATATWFSYPSGHALVSIAVYGALAWLIWSGLRSPRARAVCLVGAAVLVAAIGFSRLYLGVHYLSDVLAGYCAGIAWLLLAIESVRAGERSLLRWRVRRAAYRRSLRAALLAPLLVPAVACGSGDESGKPPPLPRAGEAVDLDAADFVAQIDNEYWPMAPGTRWVYRGSDGERVEVLVTERRKNILGIDATVVHDIESEDGEVVEDTYDWFAQDRWGNVWYLGEDTKEYEDGKVVSTKGSWEHGVDGAQAGVVMPADPEVGVAFRQEHYEGEAEDRGEILGLDEQEKVPFGSFDGLLETKDTTPLEPKAVEHKYYAKGIGPILAVGVSSGSREELLSFEPG
jgi:membrane-associated phospholipid phosphatase